MTESEIARLRDEIAALDRELMTLVARRLHLAEEVGREKRLAGLPVRQSDVEEQVVARLRQEGQALRVRPEVSDALGRVLIEESVRRQEALRDPVPLGKRAVVVGGGGRMGRLFARYLRSAGYEVVVVDPAGSAGFPSEGDLGSAVARSDVVVVAVPVSVASDVLRELHRLRPTALVFDVASLKGPLADGLRSMTRDGLRAASVHPLFGPHLWPLTRGTILLCDCGSPEAVRSAKGLLRGMGPNLVDLPLDDHDEFMAYLLGLSHLAVLAFARVAATTPVDPGLAAAEGTTYARLATVARGLLEDSPALLRDIEALNPDTPHVIRRLRDALAEWERAAAHADGKEFITLLESTRASLGGTTP